MRNRVAMRAIVSLIALAWLACSSRSATPTNRSAKPPPPPLQLFRVAADRQILSIQMTPDDHVLDGTGAAIGSFDAKSRSVTIGDVTIALDDVVRRQANRHVELQLPIGAWLIDVAVGGEVSVNGARWGRLEGFDATPQAWQQLEALFAALPVLPTAPASRRRPP